MAIPQEIISLANDREDTSSLDDKDDELSEQEQERRKRNSQASKRLRMKLNMKLETVKKMYFEESERNTKLKYEVHNAKLDLIKWINIAENLKVKNPIFNYRLNIRPELAQCFIKKGNLLIRGGAVSMPFTHIMTTGKETAIRETTHDKYSLSTSQLITVAADQLKDVGIFSMSKESLPPNEVMRSTDSNLSISTPVSYKMNYPADRMMVNHTADGIPAMASLLMTSVCSTVGGQNKGIFQISSTVTTCSPSADGREPIASTASATVTDLDLADRMMVNHTADGIPAIVSVLTSVCSTVGGQNKEISQVASTVTTYIPSADGREPIASSATSTVTDLDQLDELKRLAETITETSQKAELTSSSIHTVIENKTPISEVQYQAGNVNSMPKGQLHAYVASGDSDVLPAASDDINDIGKQPLGPTTQLTIPDFEILKPTQVEDHGDNQQGGRAICPKNNRVFKKKLKYSRRTINKGNSCKATGTQDILVSAEQNQTMAIQPSVLCQGFQPNYTIQGTGQCNVMNIVDQRYMLPIKKMSSEEAIEVIKANLLQGTTPGMFNK